MREGADMLMVKPGMAYLDIVRQTKDRVSSHLSLSSQPHVWPGKTTTCLVKFYAHPISHTFCEKN